MPDIAPSTRAVPPVTRAVEAADRLAQRQRPAPRSLPNGLVVLLSLAAAVVAIAGMRAIPDIIGPSFLALTLAITVYPVQRKMGLVMPKWAAMILALLLVYVILLGFLVALVWAMAQLATEVPTYRDQLNGLWQQATQLLTRFNISQEQIQDQLRGISPGNVFGVAQSLLSSVSGVLSQFVFVLTAAIFLAVDSMDISKRLGMIERTHPALVAGLVKFSKGVRSYWWVTTVFGLIVAVLNVVSLWFIGVPLIITWGVLSFLTNYIPNVGFVLGMIPPTLMALLVGGPVDAILVVATYCVFNFVIQSVIQPKFTGDSVGVNTTMAFLSLMFWSYVIGPLGALLALPLTLLVKNLFIDIEPGARWLNFLISSDPSSDVAIGVDIDEYLAGDDHQPEADTGHVSKPGMGEGDDPTASAPGAGPRDEGSRRWAASAATAAGRPDGSVEPDASTGESSPTATSSDGGASAAGQPTERADGESKSDARPVEGRPDEEADAASTAGQSPAREQTVDDRPGRARREGDGDPGATATT